MSTTIWRTTAIGFICLCAPFLLLGTANAMEINPDACLDISQVEDCRGRTDGGCTRYEEVAPAKDKDSCPEYREINDPAHYDKYGRYLGRDSDPRYKDSGGN